MGKDNFMISVSSVCSVANSSYDIEEAAKLFTALFRKIACP